MSLEIVAEINVLVACFARCIFTPESEIVSVFLLGEFRWAPI